MATDDEDPKVKQLLDPATQADLARWFSLPSFQQVAEQPAPPPVIDEEMKAAIERRDKALANVDPALVEALFRAEQKPEQLLKFKSTIDVIVDEQFGSLDEQMISKIGSIADPREVEIAEELRDDMKDCTPQALLRDLHRAELYFDKQFERTDVTEGLRVDVVAEVATAMKTSWKLTEPGPSPVAEGRALLADLRAQRRSKWTDVLPTLRNRRVSE
jgi:hypothetical protein